MPITNVNSSADKGPGGGGRTTFRPPWVKGGDGPQPVPMPTTPWSKRNSLTTDAAKENGQTSLKDVKLQSREVKVPVTTTTKKTLTPLKKKDEKKEEEDEEKKPTGSSAAEKSGKFVRPALKKVAKVEEATKPPGKGSLATTDKKSVPVGKSKAPVVEESSEEEEESSYEEVTDTETETDSDEAPPISNKKGKCPRLLLNASFFSLDNDQIEIGTQLYYTRELRELNMYGLNLARKIFQL